MARALGIAVYHRLAFAELIARVAEPLLDIVGDTELAIGDDSRGHASATAIRELTLGDLVDGPDKRLVLTRPGDPVPAAVIYDPQMVQRRALTTHLLVAVVPEEGFDIAAFRALAEALDARYAFVTVAANAAAAYDEALWPDARGRLGKATDRRHNDAWLQLMRSFGRPEIGFGIPDVYWANHFGSQLINELKRADTWEPLESALDLTYLESGAVLFTVTARPDDPGLDDALRAAGDLVAPLGLMRRALNQARQGDGLLLQALVATADLRLLHGMAFHGGLGAFARLAGLDPDEVRTLEDAKAHLRATIGERPRSYTEALASTEPEPQSEPEPAVEEPTVPSPSSTIADIVDPAELEPAPAFDPDSAQWKIQSMDRGGVQIDLGSIRWTPGDGELRRLEVDIVNNLGFAIELSELRAVTLAGDHAKTLNQASFRHHVIAGGGGKRRCELELPAPEPDTTLELLAHVAYRGTKVIGDLIADNGKIEIPGGAEASVVLHEGWPALVRAAVWDQTRLVVELTNTMHQPWSTWQLTLGASDADSVVDIAHGEIVISPGERTFAELDGSHASDSALRLSLEIGGRVEVQLASFRPR